MIAKKYAGSIRFANMDIWSGRTVVLRYEAEGGSDTKLTWAKTRVKMGKKMLAEVANTIITLVKKTDTNKSGRRDSEGHRRFGSADREYASGKYESNGIDSMPFF